jgi:hypothetical protein
VDDLLLVAVVLLMHNLYVVLLAQLPVDPFFHRAKTFGGHRFGEALDSEGSGLKSSKKKWINCLGLFSFCRHFFRLVAFLVILLLVVAFLVILLLVAAFSFRAFLVILLLVATFSFRAFRVLVVLLGALLLADVILLLAALAVLAFVFTTTTRAIISPLTCPRLFWFW